MKKTNCRNEYTRFGSGVELPDDKTIVEFDWKIGFTVGFYFLFSIVHGTMASVEQKPGLRVAMGMGIIFCITEIRMLTDVISVIEYG